MAAHSSHAHHSHSHAHSHGAHGSSKKILLLAILITLSFAGVEALSGWWAQSLVLLSDAGHMASDALALGIAMFAAWIAERPPSEQHSYGLARAEVIAAWLSSTIMVVVVIIILIEAVERFRHPPLVAGDVVLVVASLGLIINLGLAWLLTRGEQTLNMRAALLHVLGDLLGSIAALISGAIIHFTRWSFIDPILSIFICVLILFSSLQLFRESLLILMEAVPSHLDLEKVGKTMAAIPNVRAVHDLHIWTLASGKIMLTAHIQIMDLACWQMVMAQLQQLLANRFDIDHITLQPELPTETVHPLPKRH